MSKYTYYILDSEGYILLTIVSQNTNRSFDDEADLSVVPLLPVIAAQYGLDNVFYSDSYLVPSNQ
jgi:hypothetical protein